jgi:hypothetical protein
MFVLLSITCHAVAAAEVLPRWKFVARQTLHVDSTQETTVTTSINNKPQQAFLNMKMRLAWVVDDVTDEGVATMTQSFERLELKTTAPQAEPIVYDSASAVKPTGAAREIAAGLAPLIGAKFMVKMNARGEVLEVKLSPEAAKALTALPEQSQLKAILSPEGLTNLLKLGGDMLPEKAVSPGDEWPLAATQETPYGQLTQTGSFTYEGPVERQGRELQKIVLKSSATLAPQAGAELKLQVEEQTKSGEILFDTAAGRLVEATTRLLSKSVRPFRNTEIRIQIQSETKLLVAVGE